MFSLFKFIKNLFEKEERWAYTPKTHHRGTGYFKEYSFCNICGEKSPLYYYPRSQTMEIVLVCGPHEIDALAGSTPAVVNELEGK